MLIVALNGPIGAGKTDLAKRYAEAGLCRTELYSFALPIRRAFAALYPDGNLAKWRKDGLAPGTKGKTVREMYQLIGTEFGRGMVHEGFWIDLAKVWMDRVVRLDKAPDVLIIDDLRFHNEADWVRAQEGIVVKVPTWQKEEAQPQHTHESELQSLMIAPDYTLRSTNKFERVNELDSIITKRLAR